MFEDDGDCQAKKTFIKIDVEGNDPTIWSKMKARLTETLFELLNSKINSNSGGTVKDEIQRASSNLIEYANAKLEKPTLENKKLLTEIEKILSDKARSAAETRKINAEADKIELDNIVYRLKIILGTAKMIANSTTDPDALIFIKNIEEFSFLFSQEKKMIE